MPVVPVKLYGSAVPSCGPKQPSVRNRILFQGYEGFMSPLPPLKALPRMHSFVDLFEQLLLCAWKSGASQSILEREDVELSAVVAAYTAQIAIKHGKFMEIVKYAVPEDTAVRNDIALFTGRTISLLGELTEKLLSSDE